MDRRVFLLQMGGGLAYAAPLAAQPSQPGTMHRIGFLAPNPRGPRSEGFFSALRELGHVEGQNLVVESRHGSVDQLTGLAVELVRLRPDVIVAFGPQTTLAAKAATATIPIVFFAADPLTYGLVPSLARPGGNVTGIAFEAGLEIYGKQMDLLKQVVPTFTRVLVPFHTSLRPESSALLTHIVNTGQVLRVKVHVVPGHEPAEFDRAFDALPRREGDALLVPPQPFFFDHVQWIVNLAARRRLPAVYSGRIMVDTGGLMSYGPDIPALLRRTATYVDRVLKGATPGDLPVERPTKFELMLNLKTAMALGLTIPRSLLVRADEIVQ